LSFLSYRNFFGAFFAAAFFAAGFFMNLPAIEVDPGRDFPPEEWLEQYIKPSAA
jgi:hypothetical protein